MATRPTSRVLLQLTVFISKARNCFSHFTCCLDLQGRLRPTWTTFDVKFCPSKALVVEAFVFSSCFIGNLKECLLLSPFSVRLIAPPLILWQAAVLSLSWPAALLCLSDVQNSACCLLSLASDSSQTLKAQCFRVWVLKCVVPATNDTCFAVSAVLN